MSNLIKKAKIFATKAHGEQKRKYTNQPYIVHPIEVADIIVSKADKKYKTPEIIASALLHDVVEDTTVTIQDIQQEFGDKVAELVGWVTDVSTAEDGNRERRKEIDRLHLSKAPAEAQTIKLADLISNTSSITKYDKDFARTYMREKKKLLEVLTKGDKTLLNIANSLVKHYYFHNS